MKLFLLALLLLIVHLGQASVITVSNTNDSGAGSLRQAITSANNGDVINISLTGTITLASELPMITKTITINGNSAGTTISGNNTCRIFTVDISTGTVKLNNLNIINGYSVSGNSSGLSAITSNNGKVIVNNSSFSNCTNTGSSAYGGAIAVSADLDLNNCTISNCTADLGGGALASLDVTTINILNCTIVNNHSNDQNGGGGMDLYHATAFIKNTILANNTSGPTNTLVNTLLTTSLLTSQGYNLSDDNGDFASVAGDLMNKNFGTEIKLDGLANNGGPVQTCAIQPGSLAIDAASSATITDARGYGRYHNADIGAYEYHGIPPTLVVPDTQASAVTFSGVTSTAITASWTRGSGSSVAVFVHEGTASNAVPVEYSSYTANSTFKSGTQVGTSGWYCVYNSTGTSVAITGLTLGTDYVVQAFEYNGAATYERYNTTTATNNPNSQRTLGPPVITSVSPSSGSVNGGNTVTIAGTDLAGATSVTFGGIAATITANTATSVTATSPSGSVGTVDVAVVTLGGTSATSAATKFTYVAVPSVASISPSTGTTAGGTTVVITGSNLSDASGVKFGSTSAAGYTVNSSTQITATSPVGIAGAVDVTVTTAGGTSGTSASDQFTYIAPPSATTNAATSIAATGATLNGSINANSASTDVTFEYGTTASYGSSVTAIPSPVTGSSATSVSKAITGLTASTTYHYRVKGVNAGGTTDGLDQSFITSAAPIPTISSVAVPLNATYNTGQYLWFVVKYSESIVVNTTGGIPFIPITLNTGGVVNASYISGSGTSELTFRYTILSGNLDGDGIFVGSAITANGATLKNAGATDADLTLNNVASTAGVLVDAVPPAVPGTPDLDSGSDSGISSTDNITNNNEPTLAGTAEANSVVVIYDTDGTTVLGSALVDVSGNWLVTTSSLSDGVHTITAKAFDTVGNVSSASSPLFITIDSDRPTLASSISLSDNALRIGDSSTLTFTFAEAITGFTLANLTSENGTLSGLTTSDGGITWTATLTPASLIEDASNLITLDYTGITDQAGNAGTGSSTSNNYVVDTKRPTATVVVADNALKAGETSLVTITFTEAVTGLTNADLTIANGTLTAVSSTDGGTTWTATFTPTALLEDATNFITLDNTGVADAAGNTGTGSSTSNNYVVDTKRPTATVVVADNALKAGETSLVTITFTEAVTGLTNADLTIANGTLTAVSSTDGGVSYTATFTPTALLEDATNVITLDNTGVADAAGNTGTGTTNSNNYAIDTKRPTATVVVTDNALSIGETSLVTITFTEAVTGLTNADLTIANGTLTAVSSTDGGTTWTATFTPTALIEDATNVITLANTGVQDLAGNAGTGTTNSNNYVIDTKRPTATVVMADNALSIGETSLVTITFSEAVNGLTNADLTIANGTLTAVSSADGGVTHTATFTPTVSIEDATNVITLDNTGVADAAGNTGTGTTNSNNYVIDTKRPTATVVVTDNALSIGETSLVTITFSEAVNGLTNADLTIANGTLTAVSSTDGGTTWTATFTPTALIEDATNVITLDNTGVADAAGNTGTGTTHSNNYAIDTKRPTATVVVTDNALSIGETSLVTITFSEAVNGLTNADLTIANGTLTAVSSTDGGTTWTATFTPTALLEDATNVITLNNTGIQDLAGNAGAGTTNSNNYAIDTHAPVVSSVSSSTADGIYVSGNAIFINLILSDAVIVTGTPTLALNSGGTASYISGSGTSVLTFSYTVGSGQSSADLDYVAATSLSLAGGSIKDAAGNDAAITLPTVGGVNSLGGQNDIVIGIVPVVTTEAVSGIRSVDAMGNGHVIRLGFPNLTAHGVCWNTAGSPTVLDNVTNIGTATTSGAFTASIDGLTINTIYHVRAYATNAAGTVYGNEVVFLTTTVPETPTSVTASPGVARATVRFVAPVSDGGSPVTSYTVTSSPEGKTATGTASPITIEGLSNGVTYTFTVEATNSVGNSLPSLASNSIITPIRPGAPLNVTAVAGDRQATVSFTAPEQNGGNPIYKYTVTSSPGGFTQSGSSSPLTVSGLTNGTVYTFTVVATNEVGDGLPSAPSASVTPATFPGVPTGVTATYGKDGAVVSFTVPVSDGGSAITKYTVTSAPDGIIGTGASGPITITGLTIGTSYTFTVTATNAIGTGVASAPSGAIIPSIPTDIVILDGEPLSIYPNPATYGFTVTAGDKASMLTVSDMSGRKVLAQQVAGVDHVDVSNLTPGVYVVRVNGRSCKLIKK